MHTFKRGDRVRWNTYGFTLEGVVIERFGTKSYLIDREQTFTVLGTHIQDTELVGEERLKPIHN